MRVGRLREQRTELLANNLAIVLDVLTAQDQLLNAQLLLTGAKFDRTVFYLYLLRARGGWAETVRARAAGGGATTRPAGGP